jgi:acyl dehydratase
MPRIFENPRDLQGHEGEVLGTTEWLEVDQRRIDLFAEATGDHQWIHVDAERAKTGPFGKTIAHGYLTLSLVATFLPQIVEIRGFSMGINYGSNKLRFPAPVPVGSRLRGVGQLIQVEVLDGAIQSTVRVTVELEGSERPACVVDTISRYYL